MTQKVLKPIALDESFRTTEQNPKNIADVLANKLDAIKSAIENGGSGEMEAAFECHYNVTSATDIYNAMQDKKVPFFYQNGVVAQLWKVETNKYTFRTTTTSQVEGENLLTIVDYIVNGAAWETHTEQISGGSSSQQAYLAKVESSVNFDTTGLSGMQSIISVNDVPADGVYQLSIFMCITPKTASATKSDLVFQFTGTSGTGMPNTTFHAVVDDSQTFAQQLSFSTTLNLKAGTNSLKLQCGGLNTEYIVFVDDLTVAQIVNGVYHNGDDFDEVHTLTEAPNFNNDDGVLVDGATGGPRFMLWTTLANKVLGFIKSLSTSITAFRTGDVIPVDGPSGTAKMSAVDLLANSFSVSEGEANDITLYNGVLGYYLGTDGKRHADDGYYYSDMFAVNEGESVVWDSGTGSTTICLHMYDASKNYVTYYKQSNTHPRTITIPSGVAYVRATFRNNNSAKELTIDSDSKDILLSSLKGIVEDAVVTAEFASNESENNDIALYNGVIGYYLGTDGKRHLDNNYYYSDFFAVSESDTVVWDSGTGSNTICIILYDSSKKYVAYYKQSNSHPRTITIPSGVAYVRATFRNNNSAKQLTINSNSKDILLHDLKASVEDVVAIADFASGESEANDITLYNGVLGYYLGTDGKRHADDSYYYSDLFAVNEGDTVVWDSGTGSTTICMHLYDSSKSYVNYYTQSNSHPRTITVPSGVSYIRATFRNNNSTKELTIDGDSKDILLHYLKDLVIGSSKSVTNIRFATYNTGRFEGIGMSAGSSLVAAAMKEAISDACADIMYTQEDVAYFHATETSREKVFMMFKNYMRLGNSEYNYKAFASNYEILNVTAHNYTGGPYSHTYFMTGDLYINGVQIVLINVHLDWRDNTSRQNQLSQIASYANNFDNVIIAGDFNPENCVNGVPQYDEDTYAGMDTSDIDLPILTSVGFKFANNGYWGKKNTFYSTEQKNYVWPCDNIGVKSNDGIITIKDIHIVHHDYMDDHFIVYSDIAVTTN